MPTFCFQLTNTNILSGAKLHSLPEELVSSLKEILRENVDLFQAEVVANVSIKGNEVRLHVRVKKWTFVISTLLISNNRLSRSEIEISFPQYFQYI